MLAFLLIYTLLPFFVPLPPAPGLMKPKSQARNYTCTYMDVPTANELRPGLIAPVNPRGDYYERDVVLCQERMLSLGIRRDADEAVLSDLNARVTELVGAAATARPDLQGQTWLVEAFHPSAAVSAKIAFATKNALMAEGLRVSDRTPTLGVGDLQVITRMEPTQAYAAACRRYSDNGTLDAEDVLLAVALLDKLETSLHAGLCTQGRWSWLR